MKSTSAIVFLVIMAMIAGSAFADDRPRYTRSDLDPVIHGAGSATAKAGRDTVILMGGWGSGAPYNGQFEDEAGQPAWNGWTSVDLTQPAAINWQISDYHADNLGQSPGAGNLAAWCGDIDIPSCSLEDPEGGYGNGWAEALEWRATVGNPTIGTDVHFSAYANIDSEPGYDGTFVRYQTANGWIEAAYYDGTQPNLFIDLQFSLSPEDYQGAGDDEVVVQVFFSSDSGWSDTDCLWPTAGAIQIDDITVTMNQGSSDETSFTDFESGWGNWEPLLAPGVGDFAQIWTLLDDLDPCVSNNTPQVAFIDDGNVVEGVGPSLCIDWCYGPGGYIVNTTGGAAGQDEHLHNAVESPVMPWPGQGLTGAQLAFTVYEHEDLSVDAPGMFYTWSVRSTASGDEADIVDAPWVDRNFVYFGGPWYGRDRLVVTDLLEPGLTHVQIQLTVYELGFAFGFVGNDGYPAPYFDNVRFICYDQVGPGMAAREIDLAQDNFPSIGEVDLTNLGNNSVRFDMANTSSFTADLANIPGDSIVLDIAPVRPGSDLVGMPELHWIMQANPLFDSHRSSVFGTGRRGVSEGYFSRHPNGTIVPDRFAFDLPDSGFLYPGDVLHYYILARDDDGLEVQAACIPADTSGFDDFGWMSAYSSSFTLRALPSVYEDSLNPGDYTQPKVLLWNDFGNRGGENEWEFALANLGWSEGVDFDVYYTNGPSSGVGNGLGGRATALSLMGYDDLLYTCGDLGTWTLSNGDYSNDPSNDIELLDSWLRLGGKDAFFTGDGLISDLVFHAGAAGAQFVNDWLKVSLIGDSLRFLVSNQTAPLVRAVPGNGIIQDDMVWRAYGGCPVINNFDAVVPISSEGAIRLAEFTDPSGQPGHYEFSAATYYHDLTHDSRVITLPYDFMSVYTEPGAGYFIPTRARLLEQVLVAFGLDSNIWFAPVPSAEKFALKAYPNPFNPATRIEFNLPRDGHLTLKMFDVKGRLVRVLVDEDRLGGAGHVMWDGTDDQGRRLGSGVYFAEARTAGQVKVQKVAMVK